MFLKELNTKHPLVKFEQEILNERITFLVTEIVTKKSKVYTKIFRKKTDHKSFWTLTQRIKTRQKSASIRPDRHYE